jgi:peptidoglycan/xylan/chitin deacetylase (PgdA/CDA1 family)
MTPLISLLFHDVYARVPAESGFTGAIADRYKLSIAEFGTALSAIATRAPRVVRVACASDLARTERSVAITADDGGASYALHIADALEEHGWRGHCFMTTDMIGRPGFLTEADLRDLDRRGHVIGSHSASHPTRFSTCSWDRALDEWRRSRATLEGLLGHDVRVASLPGGYLSRRAARAAAAAGIEVLFTSEPVTSPWRVDGCVLAGRFTVRQGQAAQGLADIAAGVRAPMARQWINWRAKKLLKPVMGPLYPRLGEWVARHARQTEA